MALWHWARNRPVLETILEKLWAPVHGTVAGGSRAFAAGGRGANRPAAKGNNATAALLGGGAGQRVPKRSRAGVPNDRGALQGAIRICGAQRAGTRGQTARGPSWEGAGLCAQ